MYERLIFVCRENTSRSIMAESIYKSISEKEKPEVFSRGMVVLFPEPINSKVITVLENHELSPVRQESVPLRKEDIVENTLVLTMDEKIKNQLLKDYPDLKSVYTLKGFSGELGDVKDPYGGTLLDYEDCFNELVVLIKKTIYKLGL